MLTPALPRLANAMSQIGSLSTKLKVNITRPLSGGIATKMAPRQSMLKAGFQSVIQAPKTRARIVRYELTYREWAAIRPMLPNKPRGMPRVNDRRILNGIFWVLRPGAPWRDLPRRFGPYTTCYNRLVR